MSNRASYLAAGATVVAAGGDTIGTIRAVYPHYLAVESSDHPPTAYRVPTGAISGYDGTTVTLSVERDALDTMTPEASAAFGLPEHGGTLELRPTALVGDAEDRDGTSDDRGPTEASDET